MAWRKEENEEKVKYKIMNSGLLSAISFFSFCAAVLYAGSGDYIFLLKYSVMSFRWLSLRFGPGHNRIQFSIFYENNFTVFITE